MRDTARSSPLFSKELVIYFIIDWMRWRILFERYFKLFRPNSRFERIRENDGLFAQASLNKLSKSHMRSTRQFVARNMKKHKCIHFDSVLSDYTCVGLIIWVTLGNAVVFMVACILILQLLKCYIPQILVKSHMFRHFFICIWIKWLKKCICTWDSRTHKK